MFTLGCNKNRNAYPKITSGFGPGVEYMNCGGHGYFSGYTFEQVQASWSPCWTTANNFVHRIVVQQEVVVVRL